ncbi:MAG TPA: response regulator [Desulfobulbus sp.]|nr:response regulator [Desulfobulbus sp.]
MEQTILLVDDEDMFRERLGRAFGARNYTVYLAAGYTEAMTLIRRHHPAMAVVDLKMPDKSGLDVLRDGLALHPAMRIVVLTGYGSIATATEAIRAGAVSYLPKPADVDDILCAFKADSRSPSRGEQEDFPVPSLARMEWEHINRVLHDCGGNISAAARKLGLHRRTLQRKLNKFPPLQ